MDTIHAIRSYIDKIVTSIPGMKALLLDSDTKQIVAMVYSQVCILGMVVLYICVFVCIDVCYVCVHVDRYVCMYVSISLYITIYKYILYIYMYLFIYLFIHVCVLVPYACFAWQV
jgi:hypothetical protein